MRSGGNVESALFGTTGPQRPTSIQSPGASTTSTVNISRERLNQLRRPCPVLNNDQKRELQRKALEDAAERMLQEARRGSSLRASCKPVEPESEAHTAVAFKKKQEREKARERAARSALEDLPEARLMDHMVRAAKTMAELDRQVEGARQAAEEQSKAQTAADQRILAIWEKELAAEREAEELRIRKYRAGEAQILLQLEERRQAAMAQAEATQAEGAAMRKEAERLALVEREQEEARRMAGTALLAEVEAFNAQRRGRQQEALRQEREEDARIVRLLAEKDAQAQAEVEERAAAQKQADLTLAMHWATVQRRQDSEDEAELRLIQRYQEEREAADIAREEAETAAKLEAQAAQWNAMKEQLEEKKHRQAAANLEAAEEARLASKAAAAVHKQVLEEMAARKREMDELRNQLDRQCDERQRIRKDQGATRSAAAAAANAARETQRKALLALKQEKLVLLKDVPAKYRAELENLVIS